MLYGQWSTGWVTVKAVEFKRFNRIGNEVPLAFVMENLELAPRVDLFPDERVVYLGIRWGELFHRCSGDEWLQLLEYLRGKEIPVTRHRWWKLWE